MVLWGGAAEAATGKVLADALFETGAVGGIALYSQEMNDSGGDKKGTKDMTIGGVALLL